MATYHGYINWCNYVCVIHTKMWACIIHGNIRYIVRWVYVIVTSSRCIFPLISIQHFCVLCDAFSFKNTFRLTINCYPCFLSAHIFLTYLFIISSFFILSHALSVSCRKYINEFLKTFLVNIKT